MVVVSQHAFLAFVTVFGAQGLVFVAHPAQLLLGSVGSRIVGGFHAKFLDILNAIEVVGGLQVVSLYEVGVQSHCLS